MSDPTRPESPDLPHEPASEASPVPPASTDAPETPAPAPPVDSSLPAPPSPGTGDDERSTRWPRVIGTIGMVMGALLFLDEIDDLWIALMWSEETWGRFFSPSLSRIIARSLEPTAWLVLSGLIEMALATTLFFGSMKLMRRRMSGVRLLRTWATVAIGWLVIAYTWAFISLNRVVEAIPGITNVGWQGPAAFGVLVGMMLIMVPPVFLLYWFTRRDVRGETTSWPD